MIKEKYLKRRGREELSIRKLREVKRKRATLLHSEYFRSSRRLHSSNEGIGLGQQYKYLSRCLQRQFSLLFFDFLRELSDRCEENMNRVGVDLHTSKSDHWSCPFEFGGEKLKEDVQVLFHQFYAWLIRKDGRGKKVREVRREVEELVRRTHLDKSIAARAIWKVSQLSSLLHRQGGY